MTRSTAAELARFEAEMPQELERLTFAHALMSRFVGVLERATQLRFPNPKYQQAPRLFFREVLGVEPWAKPVQVMNAFRDHKRVAVKSGHKVAKSHTIAGCALWFYCSFEDARGIMTSTTSRQVDQILWRELRMMRARSGRCVECKEQDPSGLLIKKPCPHSALIDGELGELARTGLKSEDFREVVGFTAREAEAVAGISGRNLAYFCDEASGIDDLIFEAIEGNRAGGARVMLAGNPTRNEGEFHEAFHSKSHLYVTITISSEETPNVIEGREVIPGLATREWIEEKKQEWGEESALYLVRVKGEFAKHEEGRVFSVHMITLSQQRWDDTPDTGRLFLGVDPAGESGTGDDSAFCARRGRKMLALRTQTGLNEDQHLVQILMLLSEFRLPRETPVVVIDREGKIGTKLMIALQTHLDENPHAFELVTVRASDRSLRDPMIYDRTRDALAANAHAWFRDGGAILTNAKLDKELHELEWKQALNGRMKITPKDVLRKKLGRSPDRYDAFVLSVWEPLSLHDLQAQSDTVQQLAAQNDNGQIYYAEQTFDPYAAEATWRK